MNDTIYQIKLIQETDKLNKSISIKGIQSIINNLPKQKVLGPLNIWQNSLPFNEMIPILYNLLRKLKQGTFPNSFYKARITLIPKLDKDNTRKLQTNISHEH